MSDKIEIQGMRERLVENGADPTGRDTFTIQPGSVLRVRFDHGPWQDVHLPAGTLAGEVTAERQAREQREAEARRLALAEALSHEHDADPVCSGPTPIYSCGRRRSELQGRETMIWNDSPAYRLPYWSCSSCEAAYDE